MAIVMRNPYGIFRPRGASKTNIEELFAKYTDFYTKPKYPKQELEMPIHNNLVRHVDNRATARLFPKGTGFDGLSDMVSKLNKALSLTIDDSPDNIIRLAAKIDHLDKVNKDIVYDNMILVFSLMRITPQYSTSDNAYIDKILKQVFVANTYYRYCGLPATKLQPQGKRSIKLHDSIIGLLRLNDKYTGKTR